MTKLKKILAAVLAASLLTGFSVSVASFATDEDMYEGISELFYQPEWFNNAEGYIKSVEIAKEFDNEILLSSGRPMFDVTVSNSKVAETNGIYVQEKPDMDEIKYRLIDNGDSFSIECISYMDDSGIVYVPETFFKKPVVFVDNFEYYATFAKKMTFCVPVSLKESLEKDIEKMNMEEWDWCLKTGEIPELFMSKVDVISYDELNKLFAEHLFD